jgi:hypothetical protein
LAAAFFASFSRARFEGPFSSVGAAGSAMPALTYVSG